MSSLSFAFRVCRGCLAAECMTPLTSVFNLADFAAKLQVLSGIRVSFRFFQSEKSPLKSPFFIQITFEKGRNDALICQKCVEKLDAAFKFGEQVRNLDNTFFSKARNYKEATIKIVEEATISTEQQLAVNGFSMPMFNQAPADGVKIQPKNINDLMVNKKRKADEEAGENQSKLPALENPATEESFPVQEQTQEQMNDQPLLEEIEPPIVMIKEESVDESASVVIEGDTFEPTYFVDSGGESESNANDSTYPYPMENENDWIPCTEVFPTQNEYFCKYANCTERFTSLWHLKRHSVTHPQDGEERRFKCFCGKAYKRKSHLQRHQAAAHALKKDNY